MDTQTQPSTVGRRCVAASDWDFNPAFAATMAKYCAETYFVSPPGCEMIESEATDIRVCLWQIPAADPCIVPDCATHPGTSVVIAFRGTVDLRNWFEDFDGLQTGYPISDYGACRMHRGFWLAWQSVSKQLVESLRGKLFSKIYVTGHSLGGALATVAADRLRRMDWLPTVCTFGAPRVGNANFAAQYDLALKPFTWRVVHANDIVPRVPWLLGGYRHTGNEAFFADEIACECCEGPAPLLNPSWMMKLPWDISRGLRELRHGKFALLADHHIDKYVALFR